MGTVCCCISHPNSTPKPCPHSGLEEQTHSTRRLVIFYLKCAAYKSTYLLTYSVSWPEVIKGRINQALSVLSLLA